MTNFYWYATILIFVPWALLLFWPNGRFTERIAFGAAFVLLLAGAFFSVQYMFSPPGEGAPRFWTPEGLMNMFRSQEMLLTALFNYMSFCLFGGAWQINDARHIELPHIWTIPCLLATLLLGPSGILLYLLLRRLKTNSWELGEAKKAKR